MPPKLRDNEDLLLDRLGRLVRVLERKEFGGSFREGDEISSLREGDEFSSVREGDVYDIERTVNVDEPTDENSGDYFSTGPGRLAVTNSTEWEDIPFGFVAEVINIRTTDDIEVAFANPNDSSGTAITIRAEESPFSIGGSYGIGTAFVWIRQAESASDTPAIEVIAYR